MIPNFNIIKYKTVSSTNDKAKEFLQNNEPENFTIIITEEQIKGRGQRGNYWHCEKDKNLTFSIVIYPNFLFASKQFYLSKVVSLGIIDYLNTKKQGFKIKWPNDIYYNDKKICGILIENSIFGSRIKNSVIGIGLNMNQDVFPQNLPDAVSMKNITNKKYNIENELYLLLNYILKNYKNLKVENFEQIDKKYHSHLFGINETLEFKDKTGTFKGIIKGTLPEGRLSIQISENDIRYYNFKEVEFINRF
ncbi:MAG: biotin--[acetyl-CoA-carboxylase] ligase [Chlorobi bacterium]|nr:biotin--[acetyl-CoA-carboxylase] ligase [Chlorobiota bacterium]